MGVVVTVKGTALTATTNDSGFYVIPEVPRGMHTLIARLLGYVPAERTVNVAGEERWKGTGLQLDFLLHMSQTRLQDMVVTATGPKRRLELGNDITILNADSIVATQPVSNVTELLATRVPGLTVLHTSGAPGDPARLRLRGAGSISETNDPVIIVDGVRVYYAQSDERSANLTRSTNFAAPSPLDQIDVNSIETVEVFKGPSAATMYGPDAANGVIVITTKKGRPGPPRWTASAERGLTYMPGAYPEGYFARGHIVGTNLSAECPLGNQGGNPAGHLVCAADSLVRFQALNDPATTVLGRGNRTAMTVGVSGGVSALTYALTGSMDEETGLMKLPSLLAQQFVATHGTSVPGWMQRPQTLNQWSVTSRLGAQLGSQADVTLSTLLTHETQQNSSLESQLGDLMSTYVDRATGEFYQANGGGSTTPALLRNFYTRGTDEATNFTNTLSLNWHPRTWLTANADAGLNLISREDEALEPRGFNTEEDSVGSLGLAHGTSLLRSVNLRATATAPLPRGFRFQTTAGANYIGTSTADLASHGTNLLAGTSSLNGAGTLTTSESRTDVASFGWYVEPTINNSRFFLSTGLRLDGGSTYGSHVNLAAFPKVSVSYLVSDERWFPHVLKPVFSALRLRAAYGHAGVEPGIGDALRLFTQSHNFVDGQFVDVTQIRTLGNTELKPERSTEMEGGFDADVFDNRVSIGLTSYRKMRYDALVSVSLAPSVYGGTNSTQNVGTVRNTGLELTLGTEIVRTDFLSWRADLNFSRNQNRVLAVNGGEAINISNNQRVVTGYPLFGFWEKPILGYADANHDGVIEASEVLVGDSAVFMGASDPNYKAALHTMLSLFHGALSVDAGLEYQNGLTQLNQMIITNNNFSRGLNDPSAPFGEQAAAVTIQNNTHYGAYQTLSTLRFNSLSVGYRLPAAVARRLNASAISVALQGTNLGLWTSYRGKDPDVNANATGNLVADTGILPMPRNWQLRVSVAY